MITGKTYEIDSKDPKFLSSFSDKLIQLIANYKKPYDSIAIVCIGSSDLLGDIFGPAVGSGLKAIELKDNIFIYGTTQNPMDAETFSFFQQRIVLDCKNPLIIAIDSYLGKKENIGKIFMFEGALQPGSALSQPLPEIGDISIYAVVNSTGLFNLRKLKKVKYAFINTIAKLVAIGINLALGEIPFGSVYDGPTIMYKESKRFV